MAQVGNGNNEDDGSRDGRADNRPQRPDKTAAFVGDAKQTDANAGFDGHCAGGVEKLGDEEQLVEKKKGGASQRKTLRGAKAECSTQCGHTLIPIIWVLGSRTSDS